MKNWEILNLQRDLDKIDISKFTDWPDKGDRFKVIYQLARQKEKIKIIVEAIRSTLNTPDSINEFHEGINEINLKYAKRDEKGIPIIIKLGTPPNTRDIYDIPINLSSDNNSDYSLAMKKLREKYKKDIDKFNNETKEYAEFLLKENDDYDPKCLTTDKLPFDITQETMDVLVYFIKDSENVN